MKDYYNILGVRKNASAEEIRQAYRALAVKFHPDKNNGQRFVETFKDINEAKQVLLNEERKREYDSLFVEEGPRDFFNRIKGMPTRVKEMRQGRNKSHFIKRSTNKKIAVLASVSVLFAVAIIFFSKSERNETIPHLTVYPSAEPQTNDANKNAIAAAEKPAGKDNDKNEGGESEEYPSIKVVEEPAGAEVKPTPKPEKAAGNFLPAPAGKKEIITIVEEEKRPAEKTDIKNKGSKSEEYPLIKTLSEPAIAEVKADPKPKDNAINMAASQKKNEIKTIIAKATAPAAKSKALPIPDLTKIKRQLTRADMNSVLRNISSEKARLNNKSNCVQIRKTVTSNVENAFKLAEFLSRSGYIISGRETVSGTIDKIKIDAGEGCIKVTVGTF